MNDDQRLEQRLEAWAAAPDDPSDWGDVLQRAGGRLSAQSLARRRFAFALAAVVMVAVAAGGIFVVTRGTAPAKTVSRGPTGGTGATGVVGCIGATGQLGPTGVQGPTGLSLQQIRDHNGNPQCNNGWYSDFEGYPGGGGRTPYGAVLVNAPELEARARKLATTIYWAGPRDGYSYEFWHPRFSFAPHYVRYVPEGACNGKFLVVATYPLPHAFDVLKEQANGKEIAGPDGSIIVDESPATSVYLAFPNVDAEVEIYDRHPGVALATAKSGDIRPVGSTTPSGVTGRVGMATGNGPTGRVDCQMTIGKLRERAPYIPLPHSDLANDGNAGTVTILPDPTNPVVSAVVQYPTSGIELYWGPGDHLLPRRYRDRWTVIDGVQAAFLPSTGPRSARVRHLWVQVLPTWGVSLKGSVPKSDLISVAETLDLDAASPDSPLPPENGWLPLSVWGPGALLNAVPADSVAATAGSLAFEPVVPSALGDPTLILHTDPKAAPSNDRVLSLRYDDPSMGRFWLVEQQGLWTTAARLEEVVTTCRKASQCRERVSMIDLGGVRAWYLRYERSERIVWVEAGVYFEVVGLNTLLRAPFSADDALSVAKTVAAAASR